MCTLLCSKKKIGYHACLKEKEHLFSYPAQLEGNFFCCVRACAQLYAIMTPKSCTVGMRNAILRNHLSNFDEFKRKDCIFVVDWLKTKALQSFVPYLMVFKTNLYLSLNM